MNEFDVYTFGFSNRTWDQTVEIFQSCEIGMLVDIRTLPRSKHTPQFNQENLQDVLPQIGIEYRHMKALGGLRKPDATNLTNAGWRNSGFRAYADYMQMPEFASAINELIEASRTKRTAYACTEAVFWRCHRQLVSDALLVRGLHVGHIFSPTKIEPHKLVNFAQVNGTQITYP